MTRLGDRLPLGASSGVVGPGHGAILVYGETSAIIARSAHIASPATFVETGRAGDALGIGVDPLLAARDSMTVILSGAGVFTTWAPPVAGLSPVGVVITYALISEENTYLVVRYCNLFRNLGYNTRVDISYRWSHHRTSHLAARSYRPHSRSNGW